MGKYTVRLSPVAKKELAYWYKRGEKSLLRKIEKIFAELSEHPTSGTGKPEFLKGDLAGYWSRRINKKDRIVYKIDDSIVIVQVLSVLGHSGD
jgi:toxin YoeB